MYAEGEAALALTFSPSLALCACLSNYQSAPWYVNVLRSHYFSREGILIRDRTYTHWPLQAVEERKNSGNDTLRFCSHSPTTAFSRSPAGGTHSSFFRICLLDFYSLRAESLF